LAQLRPATDESHVGKLIVSDADLARIVDRMAHQILEKTDGARETVLLGIPTRGVPLARRLATRIHAFEGIDVPVGVLDITLYRDGHRELPIRADYVGKNIPTALSENVRVLLAETDGNDEVRITGKEDG
jgi:pyrimidine operon attenuation protein/uracil phosphoribosyltransferase